MDYNLGPTTLGPLDLSINRDLAPAKTAPSQMPDLVSRIGNDFINTLESAEAMSIKGLKGEATSYEVAAAITEAERSIRMATAVREKIVNAFLEISRMQI